MKICYQIIITYLIKVVISTHTLNNYHQNFDIKPPIPLLKYTSERNHHGWKYSYESGNGIRAAETGYIKNKDQKHESLVQEGYVSYLDEHGHPITLHYIADEFGFRPQGAHLPSPSSGALYNDVNLHQFHEHDEEKVEEVDDGLDLEGKNLDKSEENEGELRRNLNFGDKYQIKRFIIKN